MLEHEVSEAVTRWLSSQFPDRIVLTGNVEVIAYEAEEGKMRFYVRVACKEDLTEYYKDLGQCLTYYVENEYMPTYLAAPYNYSNLDRFKRTVHALKLPIGLITVQQNGDVKVVIKAKADH